MKNENNSTLFKLYAFYMLLMGASGHLIYAFQTHKIISNQSSEDVSLAGFTIAFISILSWFIYGILKKDRVLIWVNVFGMTLSLMCISTILFYMK